MNLVKYSSVALLLITAACQSSNPVSNSGSADISISFNLPAPDASWELPKSLGKTLIIDRVILQVNGPGMDPIEEDLTINPARTQAFGSIDVPKGNNRTFAVLVKDAAGIVQYDGQSTIDVLVDQEQVNIVAKPVYPVAVNLSAPVDNGGSVTLNWSRNADNDFAAYEIVRSENDDLSPGNRDSLETIYAQNLTTYTDETVSPNTQYYYAVIVWDTEGLGRRSSVVGILTQASQYPTGVVLSVTAVRASEVDLSWTQNNDIDFARYEVVRSLTSDVTPGNRVLLQSLPVRANTSYVDRSVNPNTDYYYAIVVRNSAGLGMRSDAVGIHTGQSVELAYDDGNPFSWYSWGGDGQGSANRLTAPAQAKVLRARFFFVDVTQGGTFRALVFTLDQDLFPIEHGNKLVTAPGPGWFDVDFSGDNIYVNGDFFVMVRYNGLDQPRYGYDPVDNGRAWDYNGTDWSQWNETFFMRAVVELEGGLLKELAPTPPGDGNPALSGPRGSLPNAGAVVSNNLGKSSGRD